MYTLLTLLAALVIANAEARQPAENERGMQQSEPDPRLRREKPTQPYGSPPLPHDRRMPDRQWA